MVQRRTVNRGDGDSIPPSAVSNLRQFRLPHICLCLSEETLKAGGPFYLVYMPGEVKDPTPMISLHTKLTFTLHTKPLITLHTKPLITLHTKPLITLHTKPLITLHTKPLITLHTKPLITLHTKPTFTLHTKPLITLHTKHTLTLHTKPTFTLHTKPTFTLHTKHTLTLHTKPTFTLHTKRLITLHKKPTLHHIDLSEKHSATLLLMREEYKYPPLSTARYSITPLSELEQCRLNELVQNSTRQHSNQGSRR